MTYNVLSGTLSLYTTTYRRTTYKADIVDTSSTVEKQTNNRWKTKTTCLHQCRHVTLVNHAAVCTVVQQKLHNMRPTRVHGIHQRGSTILTRLIHILLCKKTVHGLLHVITSKKVSSIEIDGRRKWATPYAPPSTSGS